MAKPRKKKTGEPQTNEGENAVPFPAAYSPLGMFPMTPPVWPDPGLGFDLPGMAEQEGRDWQDI